MTIEVKSLASEIGSVCESWRELDPSLDGALAIDGRVPRFWCEPASAEQLAEVVKLADLAGAAVLPRGGGTRMGLGGPPRAADVLLSTRALNRIIDYVPADLTLTVEAGLPLSDLQEHLKSSGQLLALDPPNASRATIGGTVASNASGPLRLQYGSARDLVIGLRVANADGALTKAGGRVVKNVAGYDLNKLYTGSLGTLGVLVELSFKLHPLPESRATVFAAFISAEPAAGLVKQILRSPLSPTSIEVLNKDASDAVGCTGVPTDGCGLVVLASGFEKAVDRVAADVGALCRQAGGKDIALHGREADGIWAGIRGLADASEAHSPVLKLAVPPAHSVEGLVRIRSLVAEAGMRSRLVAHAGNGLVYARIHPLPWSAGEVERLASLVQRARSYASERDGSLVVESCPAELKERVDVWGEVGPALRLMRSLKNKLDPKSTLNPGRFVGGI